MKTNYSLDQLNLALDTAFAQRLESANDARQRVVIGVTTNLGDRGAQLACAYYESVRRAGGVPMLLAPTDDPQQMLAQLEQLDGLLLTGGGDINPLWVGEEPSPDLHSICPERDAYELALCRLAHQRNIPVMGICRGCQVMAAALGGTLIQHLEGENLVKHSQDAPRSESTHTITIVSTDGALQGLPTQCAVNSFHHQAVKDPGPLMHVSAVAADGTIEAIEGNLGESFLLGVQWHPECQPQTDTARTLFQRFLDAATLYCRALELHSAIATLDSHCDTPMTFPAMMAAEEAATGIAPDPEQWKPNLLLRNPHCLVDATKAAEGHLDEVFMVAYIPQGPRTEEGYAAARAQVERTRRQLSDVIPFGLPNLEVHFGIENGYAIGTDISLLEEFQRHCQVEYITLVHNGHNDICDSARPKAGEPQEEWGGLSPFGREVVREMNRLNLLIDLSHASEKTFYDVLEISTKPVAVTHACCRSLCDHPRNLTDDQLRAIAKHGGVVQCTMYEGFLSLHGDATIHTFIQHLEHMIEVCGIEHVGIGSDFDGDGGVPGLRDASHMIHITEQLLQRGYSDNDICRLWGDNFRRVLNA